MKYTNKAEPNPSPLATSDLSQRVLEITLGAVRARRRQRTRQHRVLVGIALVTVLLGAVWLNQKAVLPKRLPTDLQTSTLPAGSDGVSITAFSTDEVSTPSIDVFRTGERGVELVLIDDEQFLRLCGSVGGGFITLDDDHRIAAIASSPVAFSLSASDH